jgi:hypothetical protein
MNKSSTEPIQLLQNYLRLPDHQQPRLQRLLTERPLRWSELADLGHASPIGQRMAGSWPDIRTPQGFLGVRQFIGGRLLLDAWAGATQADDTSVATALLQRQPPIRHLRHVLAEQLLAAPEPPAPWPTLAGDLEQLVFLPAGILQLTAADGQLEDVAALGLMVQAGEHGPALSWAAWGWAGSSWSDGWAARPDHTSAISRLAWSILALQHQEPEELEAGPPQLGVVRNPRQRPEPCWIEPRRRYVRDSSVPAIPSGLHPAPHWRQAHAHRYWVGAGRAELVVKWIPAIWVDGSQQEDAA